MESTGTTSIRELEAPPRLLLRPNRGSFATEEAALKAVVRRLVDALRPLRIYLFGSRAEGRARPDSDFDLVVVLDDDAPNRDADYDDVYRPIQGLGVGCDVIPCTASEFNDVLSDPTNSWRDSWSLAQKVYTRP